MVLDFVATAETVSGGGQKVIHYKRYSDITDDPNFKQVEKLSLPKSSENKIGEVSSIEPHVIVVA